MQRLFKELFYRKGFQYDNMFDWTVLNLQNERCRTGGGASGADQRPVSAPRLVSRSLTQSAYSLAVHRTLRKFRSTNLRLFVCILELIFASLEGWTWEV